MTKEKEPCKVCIRKDTMISGLMKKINDLEFGKQSKKVLMTEEEKKEFEKKKEEKKEIRKKEKDEIEKMKEENKRLKIELLNRFGVGVSV